MGPVTRCNPSSDQLIFYPGQGTKFEALKRTFFKPGFACAGILSGPPATGRAKSTSLRGRTLSIDPFCGYESGKCYLRGCQFLAPSNGVVSQSGKIDRKSVV